MSVVPRRLVLAEGGRALSVEFTESFVCDFSAEILRVLSPSAEVQGHSGEPKLVSGKRNVVITSLEPVGNYAVRLDFDDGHVTGIYSWDYFSDLGRNYEARVRAYLSALEARGLSRDSG